MKIGDMLYNAELEDILSELQRQLILNNIPLLQKTKNTADDIMVQCPYHGNGQERRPSAGIRKSDGQFHCFACNEAHSLPEVISYCFGHYEDAFGSFGIKWLAKNFATVEVENRKPIELHLFRGGTTTKVLSVSEEELDKYRYTHPYWAKRGITDDDIIELFDLGYDKETDCITFPVRDVNGNCLFVARRSVRTKFFNYPQGVEKPLYGLFEYFENARRERETIEFLRRSKEPFIATMRNYNRVIVCESMLDALTAWQYGRVAVALNGLGNDLQFRQLRELPCRQLILATDNDKAGMEARKRIRENVPNKIITEYILPEGKKDLNELTNAEFSKLEEIF